MVQVSLSQCIWLAAYTILFGLMLGWILHWADSNVQKKKNYIFFYLGCFLVMQIIFLFGMFGVFAIFTHYKAAVFLLVTHRLSDVRLKYEKIKTDKLNDEEAELIKNYQQYTVPVEGFYQYNLIEENGPALTIYSANSSLLDYLKHTGAQTPAPIQTTNPNVETPGVDNFKTN